MRCHQHITRVHILPSHLDCSDLRGQIQPPIIIDHLFVFPWSGGVKLKLKLKLTQLKFKPRMCVSHFADSHGAHR